MCTLLLSFYFAFLDFEFLIISLSNFTLSLTYFFEVDDHELLNDWDRGQSPPYSLVCQGHQILCLSPHNIFMTSCPFFSFQAISTWLQYVGNKNPDPYPSLSQNSRHYYYTFYYGNVGFFVMDTRSYRSPNRMVSNIRVFVLNA